MEEPGGLMLLNLKELRGWGILASDGTIGKAHDFYFTDQTWVIRYLVVDTGWLFGRKVLVSPEAVEAVDAADGEIGIRLTKSQIEEGPGIGTDLPISRQQEMELREYYSWSEYWGDSPTALAASPPADSLREAGGLKESRPASDARPAKQAGSNLHSAREIEGYGVEADDGQIGHVEDLVVEPDSWALRYILVDTRNWLPGRKVLVAPDWAQQIDWSSQAVHFALSRAKIEASPPYDPATVLDRNYERSVHEHFGRRPYWI